MPIILCVASTGRDMPRSRKMMKLKTAQEKYEWMVRFQKVDPTYNHFDEYTKRKFEERDLQAFKERLSALAVRDQQKLDQEREFMFRTQSYLQQQREVRNKVNQFLKGQNTLEI